MGLEKWPNYSSQKWEKIKNTVSVPLLNAMVWNPNNIQLSNWESLDITKIKEYYETAYNSIIKKYAFTNFDIEMFKKGFEWINFSGVPGHPFWRWSSNNRIVNNNFEAYISWKIYINPQIINNSDLFFATLYHELDHYAFYLKKFNYNKISVLQTKEKRQLAINRYVQDNESESCRFATELLARIDTADKLMEKGISRNNVREYWPWDENLTTWESHYSESIVYAKKFLWFQIWLYNILSKHYGLDRSKPINTQLPDKAHKNFDTILNWLRTEIFNSQSIEHSKETINQCCLKLQESRWSREHFCELRR